MPEIRAEYVQRELNLRMANYGCRFSRNMSITEAVLAGLILRNDMGIPESEWEHLGLATPARLELEQDRTHA